MGIPGKHGNHRQASLAGFLFSNHLQKRAIGTPENKKPITLAMGFLLQRKRDSLCASQYLPYCKCNFESFQDCTLKQKIPSSELVGFLFPSCLKLRLIAEEEGFEPPEV